MPPESPDFNKSGEITPEEHEAIMAKVVDIYVEPELKYKDTFEIKELPNFLKAGVIGELVQTAIPEDVLHSPGRKKLFSYRQNIRELKEKRDKYTETENDKTRLDGDDQPFYRAGDKGNVYYPDGIVAIFNGLIEDKKLDIYKRERLGGIKHVFTRTLLPEGLKQILREKEIVANNYSEIITACHADRGKLEFIKNIMPQIRQFILHQFFESAIEVSYTGGESFQSGYPMTIGIVLNKQVKVKSSPKIDYPSQATIMGLRAAPKDIIGIFVNYPPTLGDGLLLRRTIKRYDSVMKKEYDSNVEVSGEEALNTRIGDLKETDETVSEETKSLIVKEYLIKLCKEYRLPLYDLKGDLLWPKEITHEDLEQKLKQKSK